MGSSASRYEPDTNSALPQDSSAQTLIDLTGDIGMEGNAMSVQSESKVDSEPFGDSAQYHPRSVEITPTYSDTNHGGEWETGEAAKPTARPKDDGEVKIPPDLAILIIGYNEFNGQVLMKKREEKKLVADLDMEDVDNTRMSTQRSQIHELRDIIDKEKNIREAAVAVIILFNCVEKHNEIGQELQKVEVSLGAHKQDTLHDQCAGIATKLKEKDVELARLHKQFQSLSSLPMTGERGEREAQELLSKIGLERAAKVSLETERLKIFSRLMKSSPRIQAMVSEELVDKFSTTVEGFVPVIATKDRTSDGRV